MSLALSGVRCTYSTSRSISSSSQWNVITSKSEMYIHIKKRNNFSNDDITPQKRNKEIPFVHPFYEYCYYWKQCWLFMIFFSSILLFSSFNYRLFIRCRPLLLLLLFVVQRQNGEWNWMHRQNYRHIGCDE